MSPPQFDTKEVNIEDVYSNVVIQIKTLGTEVDLKSINSLHG